MGKNHRQGRLGEEIKKLISEMLLTEVKDPRLSGIISIPFVEVTADYSYATCYIMPLISDESEKEVVENEILEGLNSAKGLFRREIAKSIKMRHTPELIFKIDNTMEYSRHIDEIIKNLDLNDEENVNEEE
ncbi:MAG TPA: 30S ribosome-binding factor RbfA [Anaerovoracaceae bacterium]|nr:30S ribosome-binding factor RbfA [Anaerovoracaceae bacterium]